MKSKLLLATLFTSISMSHGAVVIFDNDFEDGSIGPWTAVGGTDAGLYNNGDVVSNMGAPDAAINYAPGGNFSLWDGRGGTQLWLASPLLLDTEGYIALQITFDYRIRNGSGTRALRTSFSSDGGVNWTQIGDDRGSGGSESYLLSEGPFDFTDNSLFRFSFQDSGGSAGPAFVDNVRIVGIPEPSSTALLGLAGMSLLLRRRR